MLNLKFLNGCGSFKTTVQAGSRKAETPAQERTALSLGRCSKRAAPILNHIMRTTLDSHLETQKKISVGTVVHHGSESGANTHKIRFPGNFL
jgi:hypothetical protein